MNQSMLADRFGRRPQSKLVLVAWGQRVDYHHTKLMFGLKNVGKGAAISPGIFFKLNEMGYRIKSEIPQYAQKVRGPDATYPVNNAHSSFIKSSESVLYPSCVVEVAWADLENNDMLDKVHQPSPPSFDVHYRAVSEDSATENVLAISREQIESGQLIE